MKKNYFSLVLILLNYTFGLQAQSSDGERYFPAEDLMNIGAYYYPEHWNEKHWERDLEKMAEMGFEFTHFGEFAWANMEPEEGKFDFTWLDKAVELAHRKGLKVIMCTPTATPPAWLTEKHPDILLVDENERKMRHGSRLHANGNHPVYKRYIERIVRKLGERYGNDPRIWGWQLDNEPHFGTLYDYSDFAQESFRDWLKNKYSSIEALNKAWGNAFWSQLYNDFDQIRIPNEKELIQGINPHALLDFQRFNAHQLAASLRFQAKILREYVAQEQWITTNYAYFKFLPSVDIFLNQKDLDFASYTFYPLSTFLNTAEGPLAHRLGSGMEMSFANELAKSQNGFTGIMELQPGQINWGSFNSQPLPGAVRMWLWHNFALDAKFTCTYRFRQPIYGSEQYHNGIMETDGVTIARGGQEYLQGIDEINQLRKQMKPVAEMPEAVASRKTAFLWKQDNLWDIMNYPHTEQWDAWEHYYMYYENLKSLGVPVTFLQETDAFDVEKYPFMVAPAFQLLDEELVEKWIEYVKQGGHLVLSSRTGQKDTDGQLWEARLQEPIYELIGSRIEYVDQLPPDTQANVKFGENNYSWNTWADILTPLEQDVEILAMHEDQFYAGKPVAVRRKLGEGSVTYIGVWTIEQDLERELLQKVYKEGGADILDLPRYVFTEWRDGFWITVNYTSDSVEAPAPKNASFIFGKRQVEPGGVSVWKE